MISNFSILLMLIHIWASPVVFTYNCNNGKWKNHFNHLGQSFVCFMKNCSCQMTKEILYFLWNKHKKVSSKRCVLRIKWQAITKEDKNTSHLLYFNRIFKNAIDLFGNHSLDVVVGDVKTFEGCFKWPDYFCTWSCKSYSTFCV